MPTTLFSPVATTPRHCPMMTFLATALLALWSCTAVVVATAADRNGGSQLQPEWTTPLTVGDKVPDVTFATRTRIDSDSENPFDWKSE